MDTKNAAATMIELLQFRHSPYNERVRWALDLKRVPHRRRGLLPGPHLATVRRLTGRTTTPVLRHDGQPIVGSARIIEWLDARYAAGAAASIRRAPRCAVGPCDLCAPSGRDNGLRRAERSAEGAPVSAWKKVPAELARRFEAALPEAEGVERRQMFGCPCAFVNGNMFAGLHEDRLILRRQAGRA